MGLTACTLRRKTMYKSTDYEHEQLSFINFNMACGMQLDMNNEWICIAQQLPWKAWEALYVAIFPSNTGNVAKPCRMVLGALILQTRLGFTDRELVDQLRQNPYYQYFIGLPSFQHTAPFTRTLLVEWRKRIDLQFVLNAIIYCVTRRRRLFVSARNRAPLPDTAHCLLHRFAMPR